MSRLLPDQEARGLAATEFGTNLVVVAGAGTGKTSLLVERFLNLILSGRTQPQETVALTFTDKAAAEMKHRVARALEELLEATGDGDEPDPRMEAGRSLTWLRGLPDPDDARIHQRALAALGEIDRAFLGTIHSWCADLLRRHPRQCDLPPDFDVDEGVMQGLLFEDRWGRFLTAELGPHAKRAELWRRVLRTFSQDELDAVARALARNPGACLLLTEDGYHPLDARIVFGEEVARWKETLAHHRQELPGSIKKLRETMENEEALCDAFLEGGCSAVREGSERLGGFLKDRPTFSAGTKSVNGDRIEEVAGNAFGLLKDLSQVEESRFPDLMEALRPFAREYRRALHDEGILGFDDLLLLARNLLRDHPEVRAHEAGRIQALLVDEFQDTDPLQYEIVFLLAARGAGSIHDPYQAPLEPGRLFIVGDPKQSIYRFRGADITAYQRARDHVLDHGKELTLVTNFRSPPGILRPVNAVFRGWMGLDPEREPAYVDLESGMESGSQESPVEIWTIESPRGSSVEGQRGEEAHIVAEAVGGWKRDGIHRYRDIAILFRALTDVPIYTRALRDAGIPFVVDGGKDFQERPEVMESLVLLKALANPADRVAALGVLRSPLGGVGDQELADFAAGGGDFDWNRPLSPGETSRFPGVAGTFAYLRDLEERRRALPLDLWIQRILSEGDFLLLQSSFPDGAQRVANVRKLAERAAGLVRMHGLALETALGVLATEFTENRREGESPLADEAVEAVRIMSIHKAKGLEFEVVILPDLARGSPGSEDPTRVHPVIRGGESWLAIGLQNGPANSAFTVKKRETPPHEAAERKRLLYVAMTRAKNRLVLLNSMATIKKNQGWLQALVRGWGYAPEAGDGPLVEEAVLHLRRSRGETHSPPPEDDLDVATPYRSFREASELAAALPSPVFRTPSADHRSQRIELADEDEGGVGSPPRDRNLARAAGSAVHRLLEHADFDRPETMRRGAERAAGYEAAALGLSPPSVLSEVTAILDGFLASPLPRRLGEAEILGREVPVLFRDEAGAVVTGFADLVYRWEGRIHVADYKTDEEAGRDHAEIYRGQVVDYGEAVRRALGLPSPPVLEILFVRQGERIEL